jgi:hypothetical protein
MTKKHMKRWSSPLVIREMQYKNYSERYPVHTYSDGYRKLTGAGEGCEASGASYILVGI